MAAQLFQSVQVKIFTLLAEALLMVQVKIFTLLAEAPLMVPNQSILRQLCSQSLSLNFHLSPVDYQFLLLPLSILLLLGHPELVLNQLLVVHLLKE